MEMHCLKKSAKTSRESLTRSRKTGLSGNEDMGKRKEEVQKNTRELIQVGPCMDNSGKQQMREGEAMGLVEKGVP